MLFSICSVFVMLRCCSIWSLVLASTEARWGAAALFLTVRQARGLCRACELKLRACVAAGVRVHFAGLRGRMFIVRRSVDSPPGVRVGSGVMTGRGVAEQLTSAGMGVGRGSLVLLLGL